jgi:hypothetical protein
VRWKEPYPVAVEGVEVDASAGSVSANFKVASWPRFSLALAAAPTGRLLAVWEGYVISNHQGILARWLAPVPPSQSSIKP